MRDMKRIDRILALLESVWKKNPDWRFGQLLINLKIVSKRDLIWHTEDDKIERALKKYMKTK